MYLQNVIKQKLNPNPYQNITDLGKLGIGIVFPRAKDQKNQKSTPCQLDFTLGVN
jgi:hypothetical protein